MRYYLEVSGCQMNKLDAEILDGILKERGWIPAKSPKDADTALFFACSVRKHAEDKVFSHIGALKHIKKKRGILIGLLGCTAQLQKKSLFEKLPLLDLLAGPGALSSVPDALESLRNGAEKPLLFLEKRSSSYDSFRRCHTVTGISAFVRIVAGCSRVCSYCVVPHARGRAIERPPNEVLSEVEALARNGVKEIIFIGQDVAAYRYNDYDLARLLKDALKIKGPVRFGFVTSHPASVNRNLFEVIASDERISRFLHLPAQSGSDRILMMMRRNYTAKQYREIVELARKIVPELEVASDFIVGFPTETEKDFEETRCLIEDCEFINSFIFKYSERPMTIAARRYKDDVPKPEKQHRNVLLLKTQERVSLLRKQRLLGRTLKVLVEGQDKKYKERLIGRTWNNHIVVFDGESKAGDTVSVTINSVTPLAAFGSVANG